MRTRVGRVLAALTVAAFENLSRAQETDLANALRGVDCTPRRGLPGVPIASRAIRRRTSSCSALPLFTGDEVTAAKPTSPSASVANWQITRTLTSDPFSEGFATGVAGKLAG